MDNRKQLLLKHRLKLYCEEVIEERIATTRAAMENAQSAANGEDKSSAGDKYETSRAMSHLEKDMHGRQLMNHLQELAALRTVNVEAIYNSVTTGAFVQCEGVAFFIAAGLGKQIVGEANIIFLSPDSPLAKRITGKKVGDMVAFKGDIHILEIF